MQRPWAFWRRVQYGTGYLTMLAIFFGLFYYTYLYAAPTCTDGKQNGNERGVDCGGACSLICLADINEPRVEWSRSFRVTDGQYNAVAYVVNENPYATRELSYTFRLFDEDGLIAERSGTTVLMPNATTPVFEGRVITDDRVPRQTVFEITNPGRWYAPSRDRSSFRTETFDLADAGSAPRLTAQLTNTLFDPVREVEVVATIFDRSGNALTTSQTYVEEFGAQSSRNLTFTWPEPIANTLRSCDVPTDVVLAIDLSGSMNNDSEDPPEPLTTVLSAARGFISRLQAADQVSVVTFATEATTPLPLSSDKAAANRLVQSLAIDPEEERGSTNTGAAFGHAFRELSSDRVNVDARKVMVVLTDGLATAPDEEPEQFALAGASVLKSLGTQVFSIGIGEQVNQDFVRQLASTENNAYFAITPQQIDTIYRTITDEICEDGPARIDIIPKTPDIF